LWCPRPGAVDPYKLPGARKDDVPGNQVLYHLGDLGACQVAFGITKGDRVSPISGGRENQLQVSSRIGHSLLSFLELPAEIPQPTLRGISGVEAEQKRSFNTNMQVLLHLRKGMEISFLSL